MNKDIDLHCSRGPVSSMPGSAHPLPCRHCGVGIRHFDGRLWHSISGGVFPQYCRNGSPSVGVVDNDGGGQLHGPVMCDEHQDRPAVKRLQGETDSFGCEYFLVCQECLDRYRAESFEERVNPKYCQWCKCMKVGVHKYRDYDEGMAGPLYDVCADCRHKDNERARQELEESRGYDDYDPVELGDDD